MSRPKSGLKRDIAILSLGFTLAALVFGHYPFIYFGSVSGVHIELSLIYPLIAFSTALSLPLIWRHRSTVFKDPSYLALLGVVAFFVISTFWTDNPIRGILTAGFFLLLAVFAVVISQRYKDLLRYKKIILRVLAVAYSLALLWAAWQIIGDLFKIDRAYTLLPAMYGGSVFGIARPTGFALEPQFLASLLLIPIGLRLHQALSGKQSRFASVQLFVISVVFFLTLSRGAYIGLIVLIATLALTYRASWSRYIKPLSLIMLGFFTMLILVFLGGSIRQDNISGYDALRRTVTHISLGVIQPPERSPDDQAPVGPAAKDEQPTKSTGYIKASTDSRITMSQEVVNIWTKSPTNLIFGVGVGGFGASLTPPDPSAIVNNYYLELLVETGLVGFGLFLLFFTILGARLIHLKAWLLLSLLAGLLVQAFFFSGNANVIHLWALVGVAIGLIIDKKLRKS
jgi:hypothetical protein